MRMPALIAICLLLVTAALAADLRVTFQQVPGATHRIYVRAVGSPWPGRTDIPVTPTVGVGGQMAVEFSVPHADGTQLEVGATAEKNGVESGKAALSIRLRTATGTRTLVPTSTRTATRTWTPTGTETTVPTATATETVGAPQMISVEQIG